MSGLSLGQMSDSPAKGLTVTVFASNDIKLSEYAPSIYRTL